MNKIKLIVPAEIRYISDWDKLSEGKRLKELTPNNQSYIMNKTITGCGYTEYWITNNYPVILCSPRLVLLENKEDQHKDMENLLYLRNEYDTFESFDKDISKDTEKGLEDKPSEVSEEEVKKAEEYTKYLKKKIRDHIDYCYFKLHKSPKFLVTYDSFRRIKEELGDEVQNYKIVVDEFQSIFCDARFKSDTENNFLFNLRGLNNVIYLSATPMIDKYLEMLPEFKDLPYYELDWSTENPSRVIKPYLKTKLLSAKKSLVGEVEKVINTYKEGKFEKLTRKLADGTFEEVYSKEAVIYVNSVKNICDIIRRCDLTLENTNVLCSDDSDNEKKIKSAFKKCDTTIDKAAKCIGKVPKEGEPHKMFTLCTRTVYLGADFYSTCARSFIFSDANIDCLSVDITLDLPQILGRQRLESNPWKNRAELYYKLNTKEITPEEFELYLEKKKRTTNNLLEAYTNGNSGIKHDLAVKYKRDIKRSSYRYDFVAVDEHSGSDLRPVFNNLVMISEMRAFDVQQVDYADRFSVFTSLSKLVNINDVNEHLNKIYSFTYLPDKLRYLCSLDETMALSCLPHLPESFNNYYTVLGPARMRALRFDTTDMKKEYENILGDQEIDISSYIINEFTVGEKVSKSSAKDRLKKVYDSIGYSKTPRAVDLGDYFIIKNCMITNKETGKRDASYEILAIKHT